MIFILMFSWLHVTHLAQCRFKALAAAHDPRDVGGFSRRKLSIHRKTILLATAELERAGKVA